MKKHGIISLFFLPFFAGCAMPTQSAGSERAIAYYRESLGPSGSLSFRSGKPKERESKSAGLPNGSPLTVEEAIKLAKKNSARLAALEARAAAEEASIAAADRFPDPQVRISQIRLRQFAEGQPQVRAAIRYSPDRPGRTDADVADALANHADAQAAARAEAMAIEADVRWLFDDVTLLDAEITAARAVAGTRRSLAAELKTRLDMAEATAIDEAMADLSAVESETEVVTQEARRAEALGQLLDRIGLAANTTVQIAGDSALVWPPPNLPAEQGLIEEALRRRPEIAAAAARIDAARTRALAERAKLLPWFSFIELGYEFSQNTSAPGLGWTFQGGVDLPIFNLNRSGVIASDAAKKASERALEAEVERIVLEVRARLREAHAASALVTDFRTRALPAAERANREAKQALEGQRIDRIRALSVEEKRAVADLRLLGLVRRYRAAVAKLRQAVGGPF